MEQKEEDIIKFEGMISSQVGTVKKVLIKKHGLVLPDNSDIFVARCLRLKDGRVDKAVKLILTYQTGIKLVKDWAAPVKPTTYTDLYSKGIASILKQRDSKGRRICVLRSEMWDPQKFSYEECAAALWMVCEHCNEELDEVQREGYISIWDFSNFSWQQFWAVNQWRLLNATRMLQNGVGGKVGALHVINHPKAIGMLHSGMRPFIKAKLRERIYFHDSLESLHRHVNPKVLPEFLGGMLSLEEAQDKSVLSSLLRKDEYFEELMSRGMPLK